MTPEKAEGPAADRTPRTATNATNQAPSIVTDEADSVDALARLNSYRSAAQAIRRQLGTLGERMSRMIALMQEARSEADSWTRELAEQIVYAQSAWMLEGDEALLRDRTRGRMEMAARRLRLKGYECCPECEQRLSDPADWTFWAALRRAELDRLAALDREAGEAA